MIRTDTTTKRFPRRFVVRLAMSGLILALLLVLLPFEDLTAALGRIPVAVWVLAVPLYLGFHMLGVIKWRMLINAAGGGFSFPDAVRCYYLGLFGNTFLPSLVGGDAVRAGSAFRLARSKSGVVFGSLLDRMLDVVGLAALAGVGVLILPGVLGPESRRIFWGLTILLAAGFLAVIVTMLVLPARRFPYRARRILVKLRRSLRALRRRPVTVGGALLLGILLQSLLVALNAWLGQAAGIDIAFTAWVFAWPMAKIAALVPITQGGIGVREAALAALLAPFGVPAVLAVAAGLVFQGVIISGGLAGGVIALMLGRNTTRAEPSTLSQISEARE